MSPNKKDARGQEIQVGTRVAFNYSGSVAIGTIEKITPSGEFHIRRETHAGMRWGQVPANTLSKVKNVNNLIAINEVEDIEQKARDHRNQILQEYNKVPDAVAYTAQKEAFNFLKMVREAWDLDDLKMALEELFSCPIDKHIEALEESLATLKEPTQTYKNDMESFLEEYINTKP